MSERVRNIKNILLNNFKMVKSTKNIKIHKIHELKVAYFIRNNLYLNYVYCILHKLHFFFFFFSFDYGLRGH